MKHYLSTILLCGAAASLAIAQTIVVVGKDGKSTVFNADEVKEITFEEKPAVETITYTSVDPTAYGSNNYNLIFSGENLPTVALDIYTDNPWLEEGTYTVGATSGLRIDNDQRYTYVKTDDLTRSITGGEMTLTREGENCVIEMNFTLSDSEEFKADFKGEITVGAKDLAFTVSKMKQLDNNDSQPGEIYLKFNDENWSLEGVLDFYLAPGTLRVPAGVYDLNEEAASPCYGPKSSVDFYSPINQSYKITSPVTVEENGANTKITFEITTPEGRILTLDFDGVIEYLDPVYQYSSLKDNAYGTNNYTFEFTGEGLPDIALDIYTEVPYLPDGEYIVGKTGDLRIDTDPRYSYVQYSDQTPLGLTSGKMEIKTEGENRSITMDFTLADDTSIQAKYTGAVSVGEKDLVFTISSMRQMEANDLKPGEFYLKFNDADWSFEGVLDFFLAPGTLRVPSGVYNLSEDPTGSCYGVKSSVDYYSPINTSYKITSPVTVEDDGENTKITFEITTPEGRVFSMIYDGQIEYLPVQPDVTVTLTSAKINFTMGNNYEVNFKAEDGEEVNVEFYVPMDASGITAGTYTVDFSGKPMTIGTGSGLSYVLSQNNKTGFKSGTMTIEEAGDGFKVDFDLILSGEIPYKATYTGAITK